MRICMFDREESAAVCNSAVTVSGRRAEFEFSRYPPSRHWAFVLLVSWLLTATVTQAQGASTPSAPSGQSSESTLAPVKIAHVVHVLGFEDIKPGEHGSLILGRSTQFAGAKGTAEISSHSIVTFSIAHDNVALISGTKGLVAGMAPYGVGQVITVIRPGADSVSLLYRDKFDAIHGCIFSQPKGSGADVAKVLAEMKISTGQYPKTSQLGPAPEKSAASANDKIATDRPTPSIEVELPTESVGGVPSAFLIAEYEELFAQLTKSESFAHVWRQGDTRRSSSTLILRVNIEQFKEGSARARGLVPFTRATVIKTNTTLVDPTGQILFQKNIDGAKRMRGESLDVTSGLAKKISKELQRDLESRAGH
jgi:hypothetical protein